MKKFQFKSNSKKLLADILTPVSLYLKIRDVFPNSILLESSDYHTSENSFSYICFQPLASFKLEQNQIYEIYPDGSSQKYAIEKNNTSIKLYDFIKNFAVENSENKINGFFGYTAYNAIQHFDTLELTSKTLENNEIPDIFYSFYKYIIGVNHYKNELELTENLLPNETSNLQEIIELIQNKKFTSYYFERLGVEETNTPPEKYLKMVTKARQHCKRGDVFQLVLSRGFIQQYKGDDFNVYRALRSINPSPYLFYFDFGSFKLFGSSPEAQITISNQKASIHPIAGTFKRTGNDKADRELAFELSKDPKENAEHTMLVDLARNDLSRNATGTHVEIYKEVQFYSHVIHLVSKVSGYLSENANPIQILADTFPAGTLTGAPKYKAMQLIDSIEANNRGFYGGCIGYIGLNGSINHAILIRSFMSKNNTLFYRAGAGIVEKSVEESELTEVDNKIGALRAALELAESI